jgi:hypothetical protein
LSLTACRPGKNIVWLTFQVGAGQEKQSHANGLTIDLTQLILDISS